MDDWMLAGIDPLPPTLPGEQPYAPEDGGAAWFQPTVAKGGFNDFGPMFVGADEDPAELDEVVVTGSRDGWEFLPLYDNGFDIETPIYSGGGGVETTPPNPYDPCEDRAADTLADDINDEIARQPDSDRREYGALIWRDDAGNLHRTALVPGTNDRVNWPADPSTLGLDSYSRVVGMVHSHPTMVDLGGGQWVSATHTGIHGGDWAAADGWVTMHNLDRANFTMYISDRGTVREYDYADNTSNSRTARTDQGSVGSGDYNPGSSCP